MKDIIPMEISFRLAVKDMPSKDMEFFLRCVLRDWLGCRVRYRYSYWNQDKWTWPSPLNDRVVAHLIDGDYRVEEFVLWLRSPLHFVSPN